MAGAAIPSRTAPASRRRALAPQGRVSSIVNWAHLRLLLIPLAAAALAIGIDWQQDNSGPPRVSAAQFGKAGYGPRSYGAAMAAADDQLSLARERVRNAPGQWLPQESLARAYVARAGLSGGYEDYGRARAVLAQAFAEAPYPSGPVLSEAVLAMKTHDLSGVEAALARIDDWAVSPDGAEAAEIRGLRGDLAFYRGDMATAGTWYARANTTEPGPAAAFRLATMAKARGDFDTAIDQFRRVAIGNGKDTPFQLASTAVQIGAVEQARGNYDAARAWFAKADAQFPGFWLFQVHRAQSLAIAGDLSAAIKSMRAIAENSAAPEVMDALAMLLRTNGEVAESKAWAARAAAAWNARLQLLPTAAYGHALEHELVFGTPERALALATANRAARPYGEADYMLASAQMMNGMYDAALASLARAERSGWRSAPLYALRAQALELKGSINLAETARAEARTLNPRIFDPQTALIWFAHG